MATITFHANNNDIYPGNPTDPPDLISHEAGSGLGFFGGGFGISVPVNDYQTTTFVTNSNGTSSGVRCSNLKFSDTGSFPNSGVIIQSDSTTTGTSGIPNIAAPLNLRFEHSEGIRVQNVKLRIFDRANIANHASGVTTQVYEIRHPHPVEGVDFANDQGPLKFRGVSDEHGWVQFADGFSMADMLMTAGPGPSGLNTSSDEILATGDGIYYNWISQSGESCRATRHDWYVGISASPDSIGSKTDFGLYFSLEYL
jgi:hypothetical protein